MRYRCLDLHIEHVRGTFWLYTLLSVFLCKKSDQTDVVNVFLSVLLILGIMFIHQCFVTMVLTVRNKPIFFHLCYYGLLMRRFCGFA